MKKAWELNSQATLAMAGALGLEPRSTVLETVALPLNYAPMERKTRFELATPSLARRCSTTELFPHWRPGWDSNPRPPPWQGGILTNWTTGPMSVCLTVIYITIRFAFWQDVFWKNFREASSVTKKGPFGRVDLCLSTIRNYITLKLDAVHL